ncbi:hypothetical protein QF028_002749 [Neobacillus sp. B4I6]|jgi:hypothetical protein
MDRLLLEHACYSSAEIREDKKLLQIKKAANV